MVFHGMGVGVEALWLGPSGGCWLQVGWVWGCLALRHPPPSLQPLSSPAHTNRGGMGVVTHTVDRTPAPWSLYNPTTKHPLRLCRAVGWSGALGAHQAAPGMWSPSLGGSEVIRANPALSPSLLRNQSSESHTY